MKSEPTRRVLTRIGSAAAVLTVVWAAGVGAHPAVTSATVPLVDAAAPLTSSTTAAGGLASAKALTVQVWLRPDLTGARHYADEVSTPGNPMFRHFLSPDAYTARFGPTAHEVSAVRAWLRARGFMTLATDSQRDYVRATATVARIGATFHTGVKRYPASAQASGVGAPLNERSLTARASLAPDLLGVTGLNDARLQQRVSPKTSRQRPAQAGGDGTCSRYWGQHTLSGLPSKFGTTTFPVNDCGYTGAQFRSAYGANMINTGKGQTIAFAEPGGLEPDMFNTLKDFAKHNHLPAPAAARYKEINQQRPSCTKRDASRGEEQMDVEAAYAMAPGATQLVVGGSRCATGDDGFEAGLNTDLAIINGDGQAPLASVVSNSWETGYDDQAKDLENIETAILIKAASVGVGMFYSAGDSPCVTRPASNPYATGVGATTLGIGKSGRRLFETGGAFGRESIEHGAWSKARYFGLAGGQSLVYRQPGYQKGVVPAFMSTPPTKGSPPGQTGCRTGGPSPRPGTSPMRSAPDVSADGIDGMRVGMITRGRYVTINDAGTSLSAPLVAGMVVAAQQGQAKPFGFLNPALYRLAGTAAFYDPRPITSSDPLLWRASVCPVTDSLCGGVTALWLADDQSSSARGYNGQVTTKGYDNTTGVGVPSGQAFITALRRLG